ncbi:E3 ubiquitin-protein ligase RNF180-like [Cylas formicarius]|uniref:E3 ubiquitin-protein ligase RNF180-like n=1 Tax=Cylas formicarius TaxID=197179 RepID=UPI002958CDEB|nr:E3 ubiquitin-protein ligase RNF180-like [Cylas formicarius]
MGIKCKKCRKTVVENSVSETVVLNAHGLAINEPDGSVCESVTESTSVFLDEERLSDWLTAKISDGQWQKGRINCPHCGSRLGGFDFVSGNKCACMKYILPPVHLTNSKVDIAKH